MIGSLTGTVLYKNEKYCVIDVSGVGYKVFATLETIEYLDSHPGTFIFIHTVVREDALELFGFRDEVSLDMFERLNSVSGIGPRSALGVLAVAPIDSLRSAIVSGDISYLTKVSGIGKKTAEKILIELRDGLSKNYTGNVGNAQNIDTDTLEALESLGYSQNNIREALKLLPPNIITTEDRIKTALKYLSN